MMALKGHGFLSFLHDAMCDVHGLLLHLSHDLNGLCLCAEGAARFARGSAFIFCDSATIFSSGRIHGF